MPVTSVEKDLDALTLTLTCDFTASLERLWGAYIDPRQIERFWGPPDAPAVFTRHDVAVGARSAYVMTTASGDKYPGLWEWVSLDPLASFEVLDYFANDDGTPNTDLPVVRSSFSFEATAGGSRLITVSSFASLEAMQTVLDLGVEEGTRAAMGQLDDVLADLASFAASVPAEAQLLSDTQVRVARIIRGTVDQVWRAYHEPALLKQWLLGPDGWSMPVCEVATAVGETYRYEWARSDGSDRFGFTGTLLEWDPQYREVTTESMISQPGETRNELTFTAVEGGTLLSLVITYPNAEFRDMVLATGMTGGMEISYVRLEGLLAAS